jgi:hypothetical protein
MGVPVAPVALRGEGLKLVDLLNINKGCPMAADMIGLSIDGLEKAVSYLRGI